MDSKWRMKPPQIKLHHEHLNVFSGVSKLVCICNIAHLLKQNMLLHKTTVESETCQTAWRASGRDCTRRDKARRSNDVRTSRRARNDVSKAEDRYVQTRRQHPHIHMLISIPHSTEAELNSTAHTWIPFFCALKVFFFSEIGKSKQCDCEASRMAPQDQTSQRCARSAAAGSERARNHMCSAAVSSRNTLLRCDAITVICDNIQYWTTRSN